MSKAQLIFVDGQYIRPQYVCITLIVKNDAVAIIDTGNRDSVFHIQKALESRGLNWSHVQYVIPTHVHLDHAGGAGYLMQLCKQAQCICHPKAARHLIDPTRLKEGTIAVYGEEGFNSHYGDIIPIDTSRVIALNDGETVDLAGDSLRVIDAPGHAYHQFIVVHEASRTAICGDAFGMHLPALAGNATSFAFPTTSPTQFNPEAMRHTYSRIMDLDASSIIVAHFGIVPDPDYAVDQMNTILDDYLFMTERAWQRQLSEASFTDELMEYHRAYINKFHGTFSNEEIDFELRASMAINAAGLLHYQNKLNP